MSGNPHQCRLNAALYSELAENAANTELRRTFVALAETWKGLAAEQESAQAFLKTMSELEFRKPAQPFEAHEVLATALKIERWAA
jgi:hypothetical protein